MTPKEITKLTMDAMRREREREFIDELLAQPEKQPVAGRGKERLTMYEHYYEMGVEAFMSGKTEHESNLVDDDERDAWLDGWYDAQLNHHTY